MRTIWAMGVVSVLGLCLGATAGGQVITRVDLDNDSFNFWQAPKKRADREYTQGTRLQVLWPSASPVARRLLGGPQRCAAELAQYDCRLTSLALVQAIYTPTLDMRRRLAGERPFAGWLGAELGVQRSRARSLHAFNLTLGVTGPASLAEPVQKAVHSTFGFRPPVGWDAQIPTEVAVVAGYRGAHEVVSLVERRSGLRLLASPVWSARVGTLATDATVGAQLTAGLRPPSPWQAAPNIRADRWGLFVRGGVAQSAIVRNLFLDGSTFSSAGPRVARNRFVTEAEFGVGIRAPIGLVEWRVHSRAKEYRDQPTAHAYSTFSFALR